MAIPTYIIERIFGWDVDNVFKRINYCDCVFVCVCVFLIRDSNSQYEIPEDDATVNKPQNLYILA
jgi:hypothetical protein